jgi:hypothetical protein
MSTALILDTCVLPQRGEVRQNPLLSAMIRIAALQQFEVCIVDISRSESISKRKREADKALRSLQSAITQAGKYFERELLDTYLPSSDDAVALWQDDLDSSFSIIATHGEDAIESLHREAWRNAPAKATRDDSATGSRDAAIWLSVKRRHLESPDNITYFISSNTSDFADEKNKTGLREELVGELGESKSRFRYFASVSAAVDDLAEKSDLLEIDFHSLRELLDATGMEYGVLEALRARPSSDDEFIPISLSVNTAKEVRAYSIEGARLAQVEITIASLAVARETGAPDPDRPIPGHGVIWIAQIGDELSYEIEKLELAGVTRKPRQLS